MAILRSMLLVIIIVRSKVHCDSEDRKDTRETNTVRPTIPPTDPTVMFKEKISGTLTNCPQFCSCYQSHCHFEQEFPTIGLRYCAQDPSSWLPKIFWTKTTVGGFGIVASGLSRAPCKVLAPLAQVIYFDFSQNRIQHLSCDYSNFHLKYLNLSHNELKVVPSVLSRVPSLAYLDLSYNRIQAVPHNMTTVYGLFYLNLRHNRLPSFPCNLSVMYRLHYFYLSYNDIDSIACSPSNLKVLKVLDLSGNKMRVIDLNLSAMPNLFYLNLSHNQIGHISGNLSNLSALQVLDLGHNHLQRVQCDLVSPQALLIFNLSHNSLEVLSCTYDRTSNFQELIVSNNHLQVVHLGGALALETLNLTNNSLEIISCDILNLPKLEQLLLNYNRIKELPCNISKTSLLKVLLLGHNLFQTMPCSLSELRSLDTITLDHNHIESVSCNLSAMRGLTGLFFDYNEFKAFPCNLTTVPNLQQLNMDHNHLETVNCDLSVMWVLNSLSLGNNRFQTFPCGISNPSLNSLFISDNSIQTVHCDLSNLTSLSCIYLTNNALDHFPCNLATLPALQTLILINNTIQSFPTCMKNFTKLNVLYLESNHITILENRSLYDLPNFVEISLKNNNMELIETDVFLQTLFQRVFLDNNSLHVMDSWPVKHAQRTTDFVFVASKNKLSRFVNNAGLLPTLCEVLVQNRAWLYLDDNVIHHITDVFNGWNIQTINSTDILNCLQIFHFSNNPLVCDCIDFRVYASIHNRHLTNQNLTCASPEGLRGRNPAFISLEKFVCQMPEQCPDGCACVDTPHSSNVSVICHKYNKAELPTDIPKLPNGGYSYHLRWERTGLESITSRHFLNYASEAFFCRNRIKKITLDALMSFSNVSKLHLDYNLLKRMPDNITSVTFRSDVQLKFGDNPWVCDCRAVALKQWFITHYKNIEDFTNIRCAEPPHVRGKVMINIDSSLLCSEDTFDASLVISILGSIIFLLLLSLPLICMIRLRYNARFHERRDWEPMDWDDEPDDGKEFDVFVSYSNEDEEYVGGYLIPELEKHGFKVCFHRVHFLGGKSIIDNICECIAKSKKMLAFYSHNYIKSNFGMFEFNMAMQLDVQNGSDRLITIKDTGLDLGNLQISHSIYFRTNSYIIKEEPMFWRNLLYTLPKNTLGEADPLYADGPGDGNID